jgi:tetratricopeptide (TPR) repeat protein
MILAGQLASENQVRRFHAEAAAAANLDHPGIVPIYEVGQHEGQHFFSMGLVEGESLEAKIARAPLEPRQAAETLQAVAEAVQYAHQKGVIHRDLKPANILLDHAGHARITDFGLARPVAGHSGLTASGEVVGTPSYMPPEQAAGKLDEVGPASDVYALGAVLYAMLTGRPPFQAPNPLDTLLRVLEQEPVAPRRRNRHVPRDLETICLKALDKNPERRYRTAGDLAADLGRYLGGFAIAARRVGPVGKMIRWARRRPAVSVSLACALMLGLAAALFGYQLWNEKRQHAINDALASIWVGDFEQAEAAIDEAQRWGASPGWVRMLRGQLALHRGETEEAVQHLTEAVRLLPGSPAATAMLAVAYWQDAKWEQCEKTLDSLEELPPLTPEDYLFKGYAQATIDPGRGLDGIDKAIHERPNWTVARAIGAEVRRGCCPASRSALW